MRKLTIAAGLAAAALAVTACGSAATSSSSTPAAPAAPRTVASAPASVKPVTINYAAQYEIDIAAANQDAKAVSADSTFTSPDVIKLGTDTAATGRELLTQTWPASAQADVHALALDAEKVNAAIKEQDYSGLQSAVETMNSQAQVVRATSESQPAK